VQSLAPSVDAIDFRAESWRFGTLFAGKYAYNSRCSVVGGTERLGAFEDMVIVCISLRGNALAAIDGVPVQFQPNAIHIIDHSRSFHAVSDSREMLVINIPNAREEIGYVRSRHSSHIVIDSHASVGRIIWSAVQNMYSLLPSATIEEGELIAASFTAMLRGAISLGATDETARTSFEQRRLIYLKEYIDQNLLGPSLTIGQICQHVGVSRATLYRVFAEHGGVQRYILRRRLEGALTDLGKSKPKRGLIKQVAQTWAFADQATFSRQFRTQFGFPPIDAIGTLYGANSAMLPSDRDNALSSSENQLELATLLV